MAKTKNDFHLVRDRGLLVLGPGLRDLERELRRRRGGDRDRDGERRRRGGERDRERPRPESYTIWVAKS